MVLRRADVYAIRQQVVVLCWGLLRRTSPRLWTEQKEGVPSVAVHAFVATHLSRVLLHPP